MTYWPRIRRGNRAIPLVLHLGAVERANAKAQKVVGFQKLGNGDPAVVSRVGRDVSHGPVVVLEANKPRVLDAVGFIRRGGENHPLRQRLVGGISHLVIGFREIDESAGRSIELRVAMLRVTSQVLDFLGQLLDGKGIAQGLENGFRDSVRHAQFLQLSPENGFVVGNGRDVVRRRHVTRGHIHENLALPVDDSRSKRDGGNMPLAGRAQAENKTERSLGKPGLIRMRHDGRIEKRRGLQRIFVGKIGADEKFPVFGKRLVRGKQMPDGLEANEEIIEQPLMARFKFRENLRPAWRRSRPRAKTGCGRATAAAAPPPPG